MKYRFIAAEKATYGVDRLCLVLGVARRQLVPFVEGMPRRDSPGKALPEGVAHMLLKRPGDR